MSKMTSISKYRQGPFILFCLITGNKFCIINKPTYKGDAENHVGDTVVDQEITFVVANLLRSGHIVRAGVDMHFANRDLN
jgi:hypothetical protein